MKNLFRPVSFWQSALMTLPDETFFDLLRSILGTVKTPFNKQNLVEELSRFILHQDIQENITAFIDENDHRIIAAIALLSEPVPGELESFFTGEYSYAELQGMLLNLEERLIIYRFRDNGIFRIALNPQLENILAPLAEDKSVLFPALKDETFGYEMAGKNVLNGRTLSALIAFLLSSEVQVKNDGKEVSFVFRKKTGEQRKILFPGMDIDLYAGGFLALSLIDLKDDVLVPNETGINAFKELSNEDRMKYLAGGIALFLHRRGFSFDNRGLLNNTVRLINNFSVVSQDRIILPEVTMIKLAELFRRQEEMNWGFPLDLPSASDMLHSLVLSGLFSLLIIDGKNCYCPSLPETAGNHEGPFIAMDSGFSCILYPEISFADAMDLAVFSSVEETGTTVRFELSRDSVIRGFNRGYDSHFLWQLLERLSQKRTPDALKWNLDDWEKRWKEVSLNEGVILSLGGERDYLAITEPFASMIKRSLAPGIYLLSATTEEAADALQNAGVDVVGRPIILNETREKGSLVFSPLKKSKYPRENIPVTASKNTVRPLESDQTATREWSDETEQLKKKFRLALENMKLTKQELEELESRIERRMVVSETQLKDTSLRYEKLEARSLDYVGKTGIVKQAIVSGSLLEISCLNGEKILGFPESLDKKGSEMLLTIKPREGGDPVKLPLGKISLIRRIKQSIFGT